MKLSSLIPVILLIVVLLVGSSCSCGGGGETPTPTPGPTGTSTPTPGPTGNATVTPTPVLEYLEYIDEENGFAIQYPQDWEMESAEGILARFLGGESDMMCSPQCSVRIVELSEPMSVDAWFEELKGNYTTDEGYIPISEEEITVDGVAAIKHVLTVAVLEGTFQAVQLYLVDGTTGWIVTCVTVKHCWANYEPVFANVIASFRLLD